MSSPVQLKTGSVSLDAAQKTFWRLGKNGIWKQVIDGRFHHLTRTVFDLGLHKREKEPGFLQSALDGLDYVSTALCQPLTFEQYQKINQIMCAHFQKGIGGMVMSKEEAGTFRINPCFCICPTSVFNQMGKTEDARIEKIAKLNFDLSETAKQMGRALFAEIAFEENEGGEQRISIDFNPIDSATQKRTLSFLIDRYNAEMAKANQALEQVNGDDEKDKIMDHKFNLIADFVKTLEELHIFRDGQTRSNVALLAKLLSEEGFNPPILDDPNVAPFLSKEEWRSYLLKGVNTWVMKARENESPPRGPESAKGCGEGLF